MLVLTGVMLGVVLIVMVGESVQEMQLAGWLPETTVALSIPGWVGLWFAVFPTVEGLVAQALAAALVLGSYFGAEYWRVKRPRKRAAAPTADGPVHGPALNPGGAADRGRGPRPRSALHQGRDDRLVEAVAVGPLGDGDVAELGQVGAQAGVALGPVGDDEEAADRGGDLEVLDRVADRDAVLRRRSRGRARGRRRRRPWRPCAGPGGRRGSGPRPSSSACRSRRCRGSGGRRRRARRAGRWPRRRRLCRGRGGSGRGRGARASGTRAGRRSGRRASPGCRGARSVRRPCPRIRRAASRRSAGSTSPSMEKAQPASKM